MSQSRQPKKRTPLPQFVQEEKEGYYKAYHEVTNYMHLLSGNAWKVLCYVLRNTLGFQEYEPKRITLDEFSKGRKRRDRSRMDAGTGLAKHAVIRAIKECIFADVLYVEVDAHDLGRVQKRYAVISPDHPAYGVVAAEEGKPGLRLVGGPYFISQHAYEQQNAFLAREEEERLKAPKVPKTPKARKTRKKPNPWDALPSASPMPFCCYDPRWKKGK